MQTHVADIRAGKHVTGTKGGKMSNRLKARDTLL